MKKPASKLILVAFLILAIGSIAYCLASNQATAASPVNNVNVVFRTAWVYDSPVDNFTNSQVIGHKWWQTNLWNSPDETKAPITALSLSLDSTQSFEDINTQNLIRKGPPTLEWSFGYIPEGTEAGAWVDSGRSSGLDSVGSVSIPVTFTPGFDASRSADKTKFSAPGIQTLAITITPQKTIQEFNIYVHVMENENADLVIISPVGDNATRLSSDRHSLNVKLTGLGLNVGHTTIVTIQVTPKASEVTFMPLVNIMESDKNLASGSDIGRSFSHPVGEPGDNVGTWTWYAQNDCLWQWREVRNRWVTFEGMVEGPLGRGAGTYIGPAPVLGWRFDSGLAIGLVAIFPAIYFAGRGFRRKGKILNITRVVYPLVILIFGWYTLASIYRIISVPGVNPGDASLLPWIVLLFATPTVAFSYAAIRKVKLEFKWSVLSVIGMIVVAYFLIVAIWEFLDPAIPKFNYFFTGVYDHTFYPLAFGLLALCDLNKMPKTFWLIFLVYALMHLSPIINATSFLLSNNYLLEGSSESPAAFFTFFFKVETKAQLLELPRDVFMSSLIICLREVLGIMLLLPGMVYYYLSKSIWKTISAKRRNKSSG